MLSVAFSLLEKQIMGMEPTVERLEDLFSLAFEEEEAGMELVRWIRSRAYQLKTEEAYDLLKRTYLFGGRYVFDDYMVGCEWNRVPNARFWLPRRAVLEGKHGLATKIQRFLEDDSVYLGLSMPPGTGKTTLIKFLLAYIAGREPKSANMYVSYSDAMVKMILDSERDILTNTDEYLHNEIFRGNGAPEISAEYKTISYRRKGDFPTLGLVSLGGSVTGRTRANRFLVTDDLVKDAEMARSPSRLETLYADYKQTLTTRTIGDRVKEIQLGTIWSAHDPISRRKREEMGNPKYWFIAMPVMDENGHSNFNYEHPDRYTDEKIQELKRSLDAVSFSCLYMQNGIEREGMAFPYDELQYYNGVLPDGEPDNIIAACDVAWGGGDSTAMPIAYIYGDSVYIVDVVFNKGDKTVTKPEIIGKVLRHNIRMIRFEANNGGSEYAEDVNRILRDENWYKCNITTKRAPSTQGKLARIEQFAPDIKRMYFLDSENRNDEYKKFMSEVCALSWTVKNEHDDAPDSLAMLADYMTAGVKSVSVFKRAF